ncbi:hypothetical protein CEXT_7821 [Caerostris extrusa]|uniref:Uncharacterized protein n=1 Tax=Caerostris extrusa TaxID=172846 RepID=A0AAV4Y2W7_CAEEX|nr:hypothetical protein CEXT_7821 [Caerostris extrusa]
MTSRTNSIPSVLNESNQWIGSARMKVATSKPGKASNNSGYQTFIILEQTEVNVRRAKCQQLIKSSQTFNSDLEDRVF